MGKRKWPFVLGSVLTGLWVLVPAAILFYEAGGNFQSMQANQWGDFLSGIAAPPALLWLVIGYFQHGKEIELQQEELRRQVEETAHLVKQSERHAGATEELVELTRMHQEADKLNQLRKVSPKFEYAGSGGTPSVAEIVIRNVGGEAHGVKVEDHPGEPIIEFQFPGIIGRNMNGQVRIEIGDQKGSHPPVPFSLLCTDDLGYEHFFHLKLEFRGPSYPPILRTTTHAVFEHCHVPIRNEDGTTTFELQRRVIPLPPTF